MGKTLVILAICVVLAMIGSRVFIKLRSSNRSGRKTNLFLVVFLALLSAATLAIILYCFIYSSSINETSMNDAINVKNMLNLVGLGMIPFLILFLLSLVLFTKDYLKIKQKVDLS